MQTLFPKVYPFTPKRAYNMKGFLIMVVAVVIGVVLGSYVKKALGITN